MAKRFIDTELFNDKWFMSLKKDEKLLWIYLITACNHAGIIEFNEPLVKLQTGITNLQTVIKGLDNRLITVKDDYYFVPKFLEYQYNNFPNSKVRAQYSAIQILIKFELWDFEKETVIKGLVNPYEHEHDPESTILNKKTKKQFYDEQLNISNNDNNFKIFIDFLFGNNITKSSLKGVLSITNQLTFEQFKKLLLVFEKSDKTIRETLLQMENDPKYYKKENLYTTLNNWGKNRFKK